jgi:hypothetical protein
MPPTFAAAPSGAGCPCCCRLRAPDAEEGEEGGEGGWCCGRESGESGVGGGSPVVGYIPILNHKCPGLTIWQQGLAALLAAAGCGPPAAMAEKARAERILRGRLETVEQVIKTKKTELEELQARASDIRALMKQELTAETIGIILVWEGEMEAREGVDALALNRN